MGLKRMPRPADDMNMEKKAVLKAEIVEWSEEGYINALSAVQEISVSVV